jgi:trehalose 6-phosphate phosphatase
MNSTPRPAPPAPRADWAYFLDLDGTLVPLGETPDHVVVPPFLPAFLTAFADWAGGAVAVVSGRPLAGIDRLLGLPTLPAAGVHGMERRRPGGEHVLAPASRPALDEILAAFQAFALRTPGLLVEDKGRAVALHYRLAPHEAEAATVLAEELAVRFADGLRLQHGKCVLELVAQGADKGTAIEAFMAEPPFQARRPVFVGDDVTDEDGFRAVNRLGGISIRVGDDRPSDARYGLADVAAVLDWLRSPAG